MMETRRLTGDRKCSHELLTSWLGKTMQRKNGLVQLELIRCPTTKTSASCSNPESIKASASAQKGGIHRKRENFLPQLAQVSVASP
jgi:hypothetical protein